MEGKTDWICPNPGASARPAGALRNGFPALDPEGTVEASCGIPNDVSLPPDQMNVEEEHRILEHVWGDLARTSTNVPSPGWHRDVLEAREKRLAEGRERSISWEKAQEEIRMRFVPEA